MDSVTLVRGFKEPNTRQILAPVTIPAIDVGLSRMWNGKVHRWHRGRL